MSDGSSPIDIEELSGIKHIYAPGVDPRTPDADYTLLEAIMNGSAQPLFVTALLIALLLYLLRVLIRSERGDTRRRGPLTDDQIEENGRSHARSLRAMRQSRQAGQSAPPVG